MNDFYKDYSEYMTEIFGPGKIQKLSVNAGFSCPNRDGTLGRDGCSYCNNATFTPSYCLTGDSLEEQIRKGREFFRRKYPEMRFLIYFQSYTNTYGRGVRELLSMWRAALSSPDVAGLIVSTRPDCLPREVVEALASLLPRCPVFLELGAESSSDATLERVGRHHTWGDVADACRRAAAAGLRVGLHLIAGLPGEDESAALRSVDDACMLPVDSLKMHHLQVVRGTRLFTLWQNGFYAPLFPDAASYMDFCRRVVARVPRRICLERFVASSPPEMVAAPRWGMKNHEFVDALHNLLRSKGVR